MNGKLAPRSAPALGPSPSRPHRPGRPHPAREWPRGGRRASGPSPPSPARMATAARGHLLVRQPRDLKEEGKRVPFLPLTSSPASREIYSSQAPDTQTSVPGIRRRETDDVPVAATTVAGLPGSVRSPCQVHAASRCDRPSRAADPQGIRQALLLIHVPPPWESGGPAGDFSPRRARAGRRPRGWPGSFARAVRNRSAAGRSATGGARDTTRRAGRACG